MSINKSMACVALYDMQTIQLKLLMHLVKKIGYKLFIELLACSYNIPVYQIYQEVFLKN